MAEMDERSRTYWRALRFYPFEWRRQHGAALVGDLMEQDDALGRTVPAASDRFALLVAGLRVQFLRRGWPTAPSLVLRLTALACCLAWSSYYQMVANSRGEVFIPAVIGPRPDEVDAAANGGLVVTGLAVLALLLSTVRLEPAARLCAAIASITALVVTVSALGTFNGPDLPVGMLLGTMNLASAMPIKRWRSALGFVIAGTGLVLLEVSLATSAVLAVLGTVGCVVIALSTAVLALERSDVRADAKT